MSHPTSPFVNLSALVSRLFSGGYFACRLKRAVSILSSNACKCYCMQVLLHASIVVATTVGLAIAVEARAIVVDGLLPVYWGLRCGHCPVYGTTRWCSRTWGVCKAKCTANPSSSSSSSKTTNTTEMHFPECGQCMQPRLGIKQA